MPFREQKVDISWKIPVSWQDGLPFWHGLSTFIVPVKMTGPKNSLFADLRFFPYNKNRKRNGEWIMTQSSDEIISSYTKS